MLKATGKKLLVQSSPHDKFWGTGLHMRDKNINQMHLWGNNKMGELLMEVRSEL